MCLSNAMTKRDQKKWLSKQPNKIVAYKIVSIYWQCGRWMIYPSCYKTNKAFAKGKNIKRKSSRFVLVNDYMDTWGPEQYRPNFHLFKRKQDAISWWHAGITEYGINIGGHAVVRCLVPKKQITTVGYQDKSLVIVSKEFTFSPAKKQKKYFEESVV